MVTKMACEGACDNCSQAMQLIVGSPAHRDGDLRIWWCPRCGSLKDSESDRPALIGRLESFCNSLRIGDTEDDRIINAMERVGIFECLPKGRGDERSES